MDSFALLQQLIKIESITDSPRESEPISVIKSILDDFHIKNYVIGRGSKLNLIAEIGRGKKSVLLNSHFDVVPGKKNIFIPRILNDRLFARGSADAKGPLVAMLGAFITLSQQKLDGKVILCCVCDEENAGEKGTKILVEKGIKGNFIIVGEPTNLNVICAEKGFLRLKIKIFGEEHHAAFPKKDKNAISLAARVISTLESLEFKEDHQFLSKPTISFGLIQGGSKVNIGAGYCDICLDIRYLPSQQEKEIIKKIKELLHPICKYQLEFITSGIPFETKEDSILVRIAKSVSHGNILGVNFGTDGRFYSQRDVIILGPGKSEIAHQEMEYISIKDLYKAEKYYKKIVLACLNKEK